MRWIFWTLVLLAFSACATPLPQRRPAHIDQGGPFAFKPRHRSICEPSFEGSYTGTLSGTGPNKVRIDIICKSSAQMIAGLVLLNETNDIVEKFGMDEVATEDDEIVISTFSLDARARSFFSEIYEMRYLKLDLPALRNGQIRGTILIGQSRAIRTIKADRTLVFPVLKPIGAAISKDMAIGTFKLPQSRTMTFDILIDAVVVNMHLAGDDTIHMIDDLPWSKDGLFSATSTRHGLMHVRGRVLDANRMELFWISPTHGLSGPFIANRIKP